MRRCAATMTMKSLDSHGSAGQWFAPDIGLMYAGIINFSRTGTTPSTIRSRHTETAFSGALFSHIATRERGIVRAWMQPQAHQRRFLTRKSEGDEKRDGTRERGRRENSRIMRIARNRALSPLAPGWRSILGNLNRIEVARSRRKRIWIQSNTQTQSRRQKLSRK